MKPTVKQAIIIGAIILSVALGVIYFVKFESVITSLLAFNACIATGAAAWIARGVYEKYRSRWK